ncbi:hypothetical protein KSP39_PZI001207 [Platanthera zijinensis]|uniref:Uncharacterized protein n=1 Tax=Platanthera zijinensis TaxID=2320716 RepID=A0AAP0GFC3_9ASPA
MNVDTGGSEHASKFLGSSSKKTSRKCKGSGEGTKQLLLSHINDLVASRQTVSPPPISVTIKEVVEEICRIPDIYDDPDFFDFAMEFIRIKSGREAFMFCPADKKVEYLKRRYMKSLECLIHVDGMHFIFMFMLPLILRDVTRKQCMFPFKSTSCFTLLLV